MSLFGAMSTAVSGLTAQSNAFGNISDNVANSQTVGFKRVDTSFIDYLTTSTAAINDPGAVVARPDYVNTVQGTISQTDNPLGLAIAGQGFFAVSEQNGAVNGQPTFSAQQFYSRAGDFTMDKNGYLVNSAGNFLNGWSVDPTTGVVNRNALKPVQVSQAVFNPIATSQMTLSANLPATPSSSSPVSSQVQVYDALGNQHTVTLNWTQNAANDWTVSVNVPDDTTSAARGSAEVQFGSASSQRRPQWDDRQHHHDNRQRDGAELLRFRASDAELHVELRLRGADDPTESRHLWSGERGNPVCRLRVQPAEPDPERCPTRQLRQHFDQDKRRHRREL